MRQKQLFLVPYACSGFAALVYEMAWTRLLTLYMGHGTAAASTVVAAFMGGLGAGSALGGCAAPRLPLKRTLYAYVALEAIVAFVALVLPFELEALTPLLAWAYQDGAGGLLFPAVRLLSCLFLVSLPAIALGATYPFAVRWFVGGSVRPGHGAGALYAANTAGAAIGVMAAGFVILPGLGIRGTTLIGVLGTVVSFSGALWIARRFGEEVEAPADTGGRQPTAKRIAARKDRKEAAAGQREREPRPGPGRPWLAAAVLGLTGFSALMYQIIWTRLLSLIWGPTTYAFAATVAAVISGIAVGSVFASWLLRRSGSIPLWLACALSGAAIATRWTSSLAGSDVPRAVVDYMTRSPRVASLVLAHHTGLVAALVLPTAVGLGVAFPLALELAGGDGPRFAKRVGLVCAVNTYAGALGALAAGFLVIPAWGLQGALSLVSALLVVAAATVIAGGGLTRNARFAGFVPAAAAVGLLVWNQDWDRDLLASGIYKYAAHVPPGVDVEAGLKAGTLLYYRDGTASTVSVRRRTGTVSLAIDGKVDASNGADMLTQKTLAHLPLLLHPNPRDVLIIGLGSGVTLASALVHPVARADTVEISPEVVEASRYFAAENRAALDDPRSHLMVGDGRSHVHLSSRTYDVIIAEPSNPWMAGVASLFTREFYTAMRRRLAPGGIVCQWTHTYEITDADLRSLVATFLSVFPDATAWLIGQSDLLLVASTQTLSSNLGNVKRGWTDSKIAADLAAVSAVEPFAFWSLFAGGPRDLKNYAAGAGLQDDDRMALEFSGPLALNTQTAAQNASRILEHRDPRNDPPEVRQGLAAAGAAEWRDRGTMMLGAEDYTTAYQDYRKALAIDPADTAALAGLVDTAVAADRRTDALEFLEASMQQHPHASRIGAAAARLLAGIGDFDRAVAVAREAARLNPGDAAPVEELASIFSDVRDAGRLGDAVRRLREIQPDAASTAYYAAVTKFLDGHLDDALPLARKAATIDPKYAAAHTLIGSIYGNLGRQEEASAAFQTALRLDPRKSTGYVNLGLLELASGHPAAGAGYLVEALLLDPGSAVARAGLAQARGERDVVRSQIH
jgi:spermidine synthase